MAGVLLFQPGGAGTLNSEGAQHPAPVTIEVGILCQLSLPGVSTTTYRWTLSKPGGSASVLSSSSSAGPSFMPDVEDGSYSVRCFDIDENEYILDIVTPTSGGGGGGGGGGSLGIIFATYDDVRAPNAISSTPPNVITIQCREDVDDGGGGMFAYDSADTTSDDNDGTIVVSDEGHRFKRIHAGELNVKWFGAKGDGSTDDTAAVQTTLDAAEALAATLDCAVGVYLPSGVYKITDTLLLHANTRLFGDSQNSSILYQSGVTMTGEEEAYSFGGTQYHFITFDDVDEANVTIEHIGIWGDNGPTPLDPDAEYRQPQLAIQDQIRMLDVPIGVGFIWIRHCTILSVYGETLRCNGEGRKVFFEHNYCANNGGVCNNNNDESTVNDNIFDNCWSVECAGQRIQICRNQILNSRSEGIAIGGRAGLQAYTHDTLGAKNGDFGHMVCDNVIHSPAASGISVNDEVVGAIIARNTIVNTGAGFHGIRFGAGFGPSYQPPHYTLVEHNVLQGIGHIGIYVPTGGVGNVFRGNKITGNALAGGLATSVGISLVACDGAILENNEVHASSVCYSFDDCTNLVFASNNIALGGGTPTSLSGTNTLEQEGYYNATVATGTVNVEPHVKHMYVDSNGAVTINLPAPGDCPLHDITVINTANRVGTTSFTAGGSASNIDGGSPPTITGPYQSVTFSMAGTAFWQTVSSSTDRLTTSSIQRVARGIPFIVEADADVDEYGRVIINTTAGTAVKIPVEVPNGATLTDILIRVIGGGNVALPAVMPRFRLRKLDGTTNTVTASSAQVDGSANVGAYNAQHSIVMNGLSEVIDNTIYRYMIEFVSESGANAVTGFNIISTELYYTVTTPDKGAA